jgi:uncharacterized protein (TIGR03905 family)
MRALEGESLVSHMVTLEENEGRVINYKTCGTCSTEINFELRNGKVHSVSFKNGCDGNLKALGILAEGMDAEDLVSKLKGLHCGRKKTSCGDQLAAAVAQAIEQAK